MTAQPVHVLLVEDNEPVGQAMCEVLQFLGATVRVVPDAQQAYAALAHDPFDLLITDYRLPDSTGVELLEKARTGPRPAPPAVLLSAFGKDNLQGAQGKGFLAILEKPLSMEEVESLLNDVRKTESP